MNLSRHVACGTTDRLDQRRARPQETFLIRVQNGDQGHFGQIESLPEEVNSHEHVVHTGS